MVVTASLLRSLFAAGLSQDDVVAVVAALETEVGGNRLQVVTTNDRAAHKRELARERKRRQRAREKLAATVARISGGR